MMLDTYGQYKQLKIRVSIAERVARSIQSSMPPKWGQFFLGSKDANE